MTTQASLSIYKTTILPYIDFGDIFYQAGTKGYLDKIKDKQTKALIICYGLHGRQDENMLHSTANLALLEKKESKSYIELNV